MFAILILAYQKENTKKCLIFFYKTVGTLNISSK